MLIPTPPPTIHIKKRFAPVEAKAALKNRRKFTSSAFLIFLLLALLPPRPTHAAGSGNWRTYTTADGLLSNNIQTLAYREDPLDFPPCDRTQRDDCPVIPGLWVGTDKGLTYLNGRESKNFVDNLPSPDVRNLLFVADKLWIATAGGLTWLDDGGTPQDFTDDQWGPNYVAGQEVLTLTHVQGIIWAGAANGLVKIDPATEQTFPSLSTGPITAITRCAAVLGDDCDITLNNHLWFAAAGVLYQLDLTAAQPTPELVPDLPLTATTGLIITGLTRSAKGIWIASNAGVAFWDGKAWNPAPIYDGMKHLPLRDIRAIDVDNQDRIWLATNAGAMYWHTTRHTWRRYFQPRDPIASNNVQTLLLDPHGAAFLGTTAGLSGIDGAWTLLDQATTYDYRADLPANQVSTVTFDNQGRTWLATNGAGVTVVSPDMTVLLTFTAENSLPDNYVREILFDNQNRAWLPTLGGVAVIGPDLTILTTFTTVNGLPANLMIKVAFDDQGRTWLITMNTSGAEKVTVVSPDLTILTTVTENSLPDNNYVNAMAFDHQGRTWLATNSGLTIIRPDLALLTTFTTTHGLPSNNVLALDFDEQGRTWLSTDSGVTVVGADLAVLTTFSTANNLPNNYVYRITFDKQGRTWLHTLDSSTKKGGVTVVDPDLAVLTTFSTTHGLLANYVNALVFDDQGRAWLSTGTIRDGIGGVTVVGPDLAVLTTFSTINGLPANYVYEIAFDDQGHTWLHTYDFSSKAGGVAVVGPDLTLLTTFSTINGLPDDNVQLTFAELGALAFDDQGRTWLATDGGVAVLRPDLAMLTNFSTTKGLPENAVYAVNFDDQRRTWLSTKSGVAVVGPDLTILTTFSTTNGLADNSVNTLAFDNQSRTWLATIRGVTVVGPDHTLLATITNANGLLDNDVYAVTLDDQGRAWLSTRSGVTVVGSDLTVLTAFSITNGSSSETVYVPAFDNLGRTWLLTDHGMTVVGPNLAVLTILTTANGLPGNAVSKPTFDDGGRTWLATDAGVTVVGPDLTVLTTLTTANGLLSNKTHVLAFDDLGRTWLATDTGEVTVMDSNLAVLTTFTAANGLPSNAVGIPTFDNQGRTWMATDTGVAVVDQNLAILTTAQDLPSNAVHEITFDDQSRTWLSTSGGVVIIGPDLAVLTTLTTANGLPENDVRTLAFDDQGRAWLRMLNHPDRTSRVAVVGPDLTVLSTIFTPIHLLDTDVLALTFDNQGRTWMATTGGVHIFTPQTAAHPWLQTVQGLNCKAACRLLNAHQLALTLTGGSLLAPPEALGYRITLTSTLTQQTVFSQIFSIGASGQQGQIPLTLGQDQPLAYTVYQLMLEVFDRDLASYRLPPFLFDVQARPNLLLTRFGKMNLATRPGKTMVTANSTSPLPPGDNSTLGLSDLRTIQEPSQRLPLTATVFAAGEVLTLDWQVRDEDADPSEQHTFQYAWDYLEDVGSDTWQTVAKAEAVTEIALPSLERGAGTVLRTLALRVIDVDGNSSDPLLISITLLAPLGFRELLVLPVGIIGAILLMLVVGLVTLARTSSLPLSLLIRQGVTRWLPVGLGYHRYHAQWTTLTPLEQLLMLLLAPKSTTDQPTLQASLDAHQTPVPVARLAEALTSLTRQQLLLRQGDGYHATEPALLAALQAHAGQPGRQRLAARVRTEHPLFATARHFFTAAGFDLQPVADPLVFLCVPTAPLWQRQLTGPIYARLFPNEELGQAAVANLGAAARQTVSQPTAATPTLIFALVDHTPSDSGWMTIAALRAEGIQVVPIDDGLMQQARIEQQEQRALQLHIRRFIGRERDLFNVRDPVADRLNFFGREQRTHDLLEALIDGRPQALLGLRKMGKSSLLQVMRERAPFAVAHVDLQAGQEPLGLYTRILQEWQQALHVRQPTLAWKPPPLAGDPTTAFTTSARALLQILEQAGLEARLGLFIDEFDLLMPRQAQIQDQALLTRYLTVAQALRGLVQETGHLALLVAGVDARFNRVNRWGEAQNPFYQFFQETYLEPLSAADCQQMVRNIGRQMGLVFDDAAATAVARLSGGHPFLARQLCSTALTLRQGDDALLSLDLVERAAALFVRQPATAANLDEQGLWGEVTNPALWPPAQIVENRTLLQTLAHAEEEAEPDLLAAGADSAARTQSLYELTQRAVLRRLLPERLRIHLELFSAWIRDYRRSEQP